MQCVLFSVLFLTACVSAFVSFEEESLVGYHERVAIPMAMKIKAAEEAILANQNSNSRIVGGIVSRPNAHPYLGGLLISYANNPNLGVCGSVLVTRNRLLTAAHCWFDARVQASRFVVVLGSHFLFSGGDRIATSNVVTYPEWNPAKSQNNLAVIFLPNPVLLTKNIQPIAMASNASETFVGEWAVAVGYGKTNSSLSSIPVLSVVSEVKAQVITVEQCRNVFPTRALPNTICTDGTGGVGLCSGDGGGPLFITRDGQRVLIGINIFVYSSSGCERGFPSGYSRITSFRDFIDQHL